MAWICHVYVHMGIQKWGTWWNDCERLMATSFVQASMRMQSERDVLCEQTIANTCKQVGRSWEAEVARPTRGASWPSWWLYAQLWQQICVMIVSYSNLVAVLQAFERTAWEYRSHSVDITEASKHSCRRSVGACYLAELSFLEGGCWRNQCLCRKPQTGLCLLRRNRMTISRFGKLCHDISNGATFIPSESISFLVFSLFALLLMRICIYIYICRSLYICVFRISRWSLALGTTKPRCGIAAMAVC